MMTKVVEDNQEDNQEEIRFDYYERVKFKL